MASGEGKSDVIFVTLSTVTFQTNLFRIILNLWVVIATCCRYNNRCCRRHHHSYQRVKVCAVHRPSKCRLNDQKVFQIKGLSAK